MQAEGGLAGRSERHKAFTVLYGGKVLKVGRVQTPTLAMLVEREEKSGIFRKKSIIWRISSWTGWMRQRNG